MIYAVYLFLPLALSSYPLLTGVGPLTLFLSSSAWVLAAAGLLVRRFVLISLSAALLFVQFSATILNTAGAMNIWIAVLFAIGLFLFLEAGSDCTTIARGSLRYAAYKRRLRYLGIISFGTLVSVFFTATFAYNYQFYFGTDGLPALLLPVVCVMIIAVGFFVTRITIESADNKNEEV